jgi:hypothetical protein
MYQIVRTVIEVNDLIIKAKEMVENPATREQGMLILETIYYLTDEMKNKPEYAR